MTARSQRFQRGPIAGAVPRRTAPPAEADRAGARPRPAGIGAVLRQARESLGLSYAEAERETRIPRYHLQALEEERFDAFLARVYVRGFLRIYSQFLNLDSSGLLPLLPAEGPVEEERLPSLSRLGRPRGPKEAARARRDPAERDAAFLTEASLQASATMAPSIEPDDASAGRMRLSFQTDPGIQRPSRLDPLGRLGWPERTGAPGSEARRDARPSEPAPDLHQFSADPDPDPDQLVRERPLLPRSRSRRRNVAWTVVELPEDVRAFFSSRALPGIFAVTLGLLVFYAFVLAAGGRDVNPSVLAASNRAAAPVAATALQATPSLPRGQMPDLQGNDLQAAQSTLGQRGIVPVVVEQSTTGTLSGHVLSQTPAAGASLRTDTPVLLVVGQ